MFAVAGLVGVAAPLFGHQTLKAHEHACCADCEDGKLGDAKHSKCCGDDGPKDSEHTNCKHGGCGHGHTHDEGECQEPHGCNTADDEVQQPHHGHVHRPGSCCSSSHSHHHTDAGDAAKDVCEDDSHAEFEYKIVHEVNGEKQVYFYF